MKFALMPLPYDETALEPHISRETVQYHYGKHHAGYVNKLNTLIQTTEYEEKSLEYIIQNADGGIFNNAAQVYNHDFYWKGLTKTQTTPSAKLLELLNQHFISMENFKELFLTKAAGLFGSGWVWLLLTKEGHIAIEAYSNADTPICHNKIPLLTCDVWEHAYYIDYRNGRADYLEHWWQLINWKFVSDNLAQSSQ